MRLKLIIISGFAFTLGNVFWDKLGDPRWFYVPLSLFLFLMVYDLYKRSFKEHRVIRISLAHLVMLASGNVIKQIVYDPTVDQINDYLWGGLVGLSYLINIILWAISNKRYGKK